MMINLLIRKFLGLICSIFLILTPDLAFALTVEENSNLQILLNEHLNLKSGISSYELTNKKGSQLKKMTDQFLINPSNKKFLESKDGKELIRQNSLLTNYLEIKNHFDKCIKDKNSKNNLYNRILSASFQNMIQFSSDCTPLLDHFSHLNQLNNTLQPISNALLKDAAAKKIQEEVLKNSFKSLMAYKFKFDPLFMKNKTLSDLELNKLISENCKRDCDKIGNHLKQELKTELKNYSLVFPKNANKISPKTATILLNQSIDRINHAIDQVPIKKDIGHLYDSPEFKNFDTQIKYQQYVNTYMTEASKDAGALLLTDAIKDKSSELKSLDSSDTIKSKNIYKLSLHKKVNENDVNSGIIEGENKIKSQISSTLNVSNQHLLKKDPIKELIKLNPIATGSVLLKNPEYKNLICQSINQLNQENTNQEKFDRAFLIGTAVIGGALFLTGVGTVLGGYLLTGSLTAGVAAGTTLGSVMIASTYIGMGIEGASLLYQGSRAYDHYREIENEEAAFLTKNGDRKSIELSKIALIEFKEARLTAGLAIVGLGISALTVGQFYGLTKNLDKLSVPEIKAVTKILNAISDTKTGERLLLLTKHLGQLGTDKIDKFLYYLAKSSEEMRIKFLNLLKDSNIPIEKLKNIVDDALLAAKNC